MAYPPLNKLYRYLKELHIAVEKIDRHEKGPHLLVPKKAGAVPHNMKRKPLIIQMKHSSHLQGLPIERLNVKLTERARLHLKRIAHSLHPRLAHQIGFNEHGQFISHISRKP